MVTYREQLHKSMLKLAQYSKTRFVGYNTAHGPQMNGTLVGCEEKCIEMPVAENLMCGVAMGLALKGYLPVLCFERFDFCLAGADALVNHIGALQQYGLILPMIVRVCVGSHKPLNPGPQHTRDHSEFFRRHFMLDDLDSVQKIRDVYGSRITMPWMFVEYRSLYDTTT